MTPNEEHPDTTHPEDDSEQPKAISAPQTPEEVSIPPEAPIQASSNGDEVLPGGPVVGVEKAGDVAHSSQAQENGNPTVAATSPESPNGKGHSRDTVQTRVQLKIPLPDVYSDTAIVSAESPPSATSFSKRPGSYFAALILTGSLVPVPFIALVITATIYVLPSPSPFDKLSGALSLFTNTAMDILYGFAITIIVWLIVSLFFQNITTKESMNAYSNSHIKSHLLSLKTLFKTVQQTQQTGNELQGANGAHDQIAGTIIALRSDATSYYDATANKVRECLYAVDKELNKRGTVWLNGSGYLNAWTYIHRAEEAMVILAPVEDVFKEALHDDASIDGSALPTRDDLLNRLRLAARKLSPPAAIYLKPPAVDPTVSGIGDNGQDSPDTTTAMNARIAIRDVKLTLNEFRDALWDGLVRIRNMLIASAHITGWLSFVLLAVVLLLGATVPEIQAALIFYLVGAFTGMFARLIIESQTDTAVDDYGLTIARVVVTPLIAGLAALAGVYLMAILSVNLLQSPAATGPTKIPTLDDIFSISKNPQGLLSAAIFGLTPNLFISVLKQQADVVTTKLKNSSASNQGSN